MGNYAKAHLLKYHLTDLAAAACIKDIVYNMEHAERAVWLACMNPHSYVMAERQPDFAIALRSADWLVPDGAGIVFGSRILGAGIRSRVTGTDIFRGLHEHFQQTGGVTVFLLGSTDENLEEIRGLMEREWPSVKVVGTFAPPFRAQFSKAEIDCMLNKVNTVKPDILWVGISAPKQEILLHCMIGQLNVRFAAAIGAAFDFYSGRVKRAHPYFQQLALEWLPRLLREPRRMSTRMFVSAPIFIWHVFLARLGLLR